LHRNGSNAKTLDVLKAFPNLPDDAIIPTPTAALLLGLSDRTIRRHPSLPRRYVSRDRYSFRAADIRRLAQEGIPEEQIRPRVGPVANRILQEISSATDRDEAERLLGIHHDAIERMGEDERERFDALLTDTLNELR
jgi:hypothetical protein